MHFLVMVMLFDTLMPCKAVANEVFILEDRSQRRLLVNAIEASNERIVTEGHLRFFSSETICL